MSVLLDSQLDSEGGGDEPVSLVKRRLLHAQKNIEFLQGNITLHFNKLKKMLNFFQKLFRLFGHKISSSRVIRTSQA